MDVDDTDSTIGAKICDAELEKVPYVLVLGQKEQAAGNLAVRTRASRKKRR